jgi:peptidoglycan/LPS O-acetylase OafA/YrhL
MQQSVASHKNNFDFLRLLLASLVIFTHAFALTTDIKDDPIFPYTGRVLSEIAVCGFFVISGYLIQNSVRASTSLFSFIKKRMLRLLPGLIVAILLSVLALGAWRTSLPLSAYFSNSDTWKYLLSNILLLPGSGTLPGVFEQHKDTAVNGSLWTLRYEILCYLSLGLLYFASTAIKRTACIVLLLLSIIGSWAFQLGWWTVNFEQQSASKFLYYICNLGSYFWAGALLSFYGAFIKSSKSIWAVSSLFVFLIVLLARQAWLEPLVIISFAVMILSVGLHYSPQLQYTKYLGDISYGTYIYAFPIQQLLVDLWHPESASTLIWPSLLLSWLAGYLSWQGVERLFIKKKLGLAKH